MTHELAHTYQFHLWDQLAASSSYQNLFGGNIELLANCMAAGRGTLNVQSCSGEQINWANNIWNGVVP